MAIFCTALSSRTKYGWAKLDADEGTWTARLYAGSRRISKRCSPTVVTLLSAPEVALRLAFVRHHRHHRSVTSLTGTSTRLKERKGAWQQE